MHPAHMALLGGLQASIMTTRGTRRRRAPKGLWPGIRHAVLATKSPELIERLLQSRLQRMSPNTRAGFDTRLQGLSGDRRREFSLRLLS